MCLWDAFNHNEITHETNNPIIITWLVCWFNENTMKLLRLEEILSKSFNCYQKEHEIQNEAALNPTAAYWIISSDKVVGLHFCNASPLPTSPWLNLEALLTFQKSFFLFWSSWQNTCWVLSSCSSFQAQSAVGYLAPALKRKELFHVPHGAN